MRKTAWLVAFAGAAALAQEPAWKFAVSGDSRNCGDIVMPAIAKGVLNSGAEFYWHLGDFRAIYDFDEDMVPPANLGLHQKHISVIDYQTGAWPDFIAHQLIPFGKLPIYLVMGNHEMIPPATRHTWLIQFANWVNTDTLRTQRLNDNPKDYELHSYYHWVKGNVDFITLDNSSSEQFDSAQLAWFKSVIKRDEANSEIRTIVVGMHAALPGSVGRDHSMSDWAQGEKSGREVYEVLWNAQSGAHKRVYIVASHSHFYMEDVYDTPAWKGKVLAGWIIGAAGAVRYALPKETNAAQKGLENVYGYLAGTVASDGAINFEFHKLNLEDLLATSNGKYPEPLVRWCYEENKQSAH